jgi:hypothetical protein
MKDEWGDYSGEYGYFDGDGMFSAYDDEYKPGGNVEIIVPSSVERLWVKKLYFNAFFMMRWRSGGMEFCQFRRFKNNTRKKGETA